VEKKIGHFPSDLSRFVSSFLSFLSRPAKNDGKTAEKAAEICIHGSDDTNEIQTEVEKNSGAGSTNHFDPVIGTLAQ